MWIKYRTTFAWGVNKWMFAQIKNIKKLLTIPQRKIVPHCKICGWKFYCNGKINKVEKNSSECIRAFVEHKK